MRVTVSFAVLRHKRRYAEVQSEVCTKKANHQEVSRKHNLDDHDDEGAEAACFGGHQPCEEGQMADQEQDKGTEVDSPKPSRSVTDLPWVQRFVPGHPRSGVRCISVDRRAGESGVPATTTRTILTS